MKTCLDIIKEYLKDNGYDGLFNIEGECGCELADLAPCDSLCVDLCEPGVKIEDDSGEHDWLIARPKPADEKERELFEKDRKN
jgi:hypothetical protein